jgi:hypothetical protein
MIEIGKSNAPVNKNILETSLNFPKGIKHNHLFIPNILFTRIVKKFALEGYFRA